MLFRSMPPHYSSYRCSLRRVVLSLHAALLLSLDLLPPLPMLLSLLLYLLELCPLYGEGGGEGVPYHSLLLSLLAMPRRGGTL